MIQWKSIEEDKPNVGDICLVYPPPEHGDIEVNQMEWSNEGFIWYWSDGYQSYKTVSVGISHWCKYNEPKNKLDNK